MGCVISILVLLGFVNPGFFVVAFMLWLCGDFQERLRLVGVIVGTIVGIAMLIGILITLIFAYPVFWVSAFVLCIIAIVIAGVCQNFSSSSSSDTTTPLFSDTTTPLSSDTTTPLLDPNVPDDLEKILIDLSSGQVKDIVSQEIFSPGQTVYFCHVHKLAYHEDSWREIECKCVHCNHDINTKLYHLPMPMHFNKKNVSELIEYRDID